jgi:hypothetical protein
VLDLLEPIGEIKTRAGTLEYGQVGLTDCAFLRFVGGGDAVPYVIYTAEEMNSFLAILRFAEKLSQSSRPGSLLRLGAMRPKPITVRIALVHANNGPPYVLLRMVQARWKLDVPLPIANALELFGKHEIEEPSPPICGMLRRDSSGVWTVGGRELHVVSGLSPGVGRYGEYLHPDEVRDGEDIVVWTVMAPGKEHIAAFRTLEQWQAPSNVSETMAQEGDVALFHGETYRCRQIHKTFSQTLQASGNIEPIWAAKIALSTMLCDIANGEDEAGHANWVGNSEDPVLQMGINAVEEGYTSAHDLAIYQLISCYFHSLGPDPDEAVRAVNDIMEKLFGQISDAEPQLRRLLLHNWAMHLKEIYDGKPPAHVADAWKRCKERYPGRINPRVVSFPPPSPWVLDFADQAAPAQEEGSLFPDAEEAAPHRESGTEAPLDRDAAQQAEGGISLDPEPVGEVPEQVVAAPRGSKKPAFTLASAAPVAGLLGLVLVIALAVGGYHMLSGQPDTAAGQSATASPSAGSTASPPGGAGSSATPAPGATGSASPGALATGAPASPAPMAAPGSLGRLDKAVIGGLDPDGRYYVDRDVEGMRMLEQGPGWGRYEKDGFQVILGIVESGTRKTTRAEAFASEALFNDGKKVLQAGVPMDEIPQAAVESLEAQGITVVSDPEKKTLVGFREGDFPETTIALGQPLGAGLMKAYEEHDLAAFKAALTPENANLLYMDGDTLLAKLAKQAGSKEYCQALIDAGVDVKGEAGKQALLATADPALVTLLLNSGVSPDVTGPDGRTKLFGAPRKMTRALLAGKANPNFTDPEGNTPLFLAEDPEVIKDLVKGGAVPNQANGEGKTALMGREIAVTRALLAAGANPALKDKAGKTALDYAEGDAALVALLKKPSKGVKPGK